MRRLGKITFVWVAAIMAVVDPASACRFRWRCCRPVYRCYNPCYTTCYTSCDSCGGCSSCGSGGAVLGGADSGPQPTPAPVPPGGAQPESILPEPQRPAPSRDVPPRAEEPAPAFPADTMPEEPAPAFPAEPAPAEPAPADRAPATPPAPAPAADVEDLFKDTEDKSPPAELEKPAAEPEKKADDLDDLFKDSDEKKSTQTTPATQREFEALFVDPPVQVAKPAVTSNPNEMRVWIDNTGKYRVNAQLVSVGNSSVRLLKDNGKYTTVSFGRLSLADLAFVRSLSTPVVDSAR